MAAVAAVRSRGGAFTISDWRDLDADENQPRRGRTRQRRVEAEAAARARAHDRREQCLTQTNAFLLWTCPLLLVLVAVCVRGFTSTVAAQEYVTWMDHLHIMWSQSDRTKDTAERETLDDRFVKFTEKWSIDAGSVLACMSIMPLFWLMCVGIFQDVRSWIRTCISVSLLTTLNALLTWSTLLPDTRGWGACKTALGEDGLSYYSSLEVNFDVLFDAVLIELQQLAGLWTVPPDRAYRCGNTLCNYPICINLIFSLSTLDAVRSALQRASSATENPRFPSVVVVVTSIVGGAVTILVAASACVYTVARYGYTLELVVACLITWLIYGSVPVNLAVETWLSALTPEDDLVTNLKLAGLPQDLAQVEVVPCSRSYYVRGRPPPRKVPHRPASATDLLRTAREARTVSERGKEEAVQKVKELEKALIDAEASAKLKHEEQEAILIKSFTERMRCEQRMLDEEYAARCVAAQERLASERRSLVQRQDKIGTDNERLSQAESVGRKACKELEVNTATIWQQLGGMGVANEQIALPTNPICDDDANSDSDADTTQFCISWLGDGLKSDEWTTIAVHADSTVCELASRAAEAFGIQDQGREVVLLKKGKPIQRKRSVTGLPRTLTMVFHPLLDVSGIWTGWTDQGGFLVTMLQDFTSGAVTGIARMPSGEDRKIEGRSSGEQCTLEMECSEELFGWQSVQVESQSTLQGEQVLQSTVGDWNLLRGPKFATRATASDLNGKWFWPVFPSVFELAHDKNAGKISGAAVLDGEHWNGETLTITGHVNSNILSFKIQLPESLLGGGGTKTVLARVSSDGLTISGDGLSILAAGNHAFKWWRVDSDAA